MSLEVLHCRFTSSPCCEVLHILTNNFEQGWFHDFTLISHWSAPRWLVQTKAWFLSSHSAGTWPCSHEHVAKNADILRRPLTSLSIEVWPGHVHVHVKRNRSTTRRPMTRQRLSLVADVSSTSVKLLIEARCTVEFGHHKRVSDSALS